MLSLRASSFVHIFEQEGRLLLEMLCVTTDCSCHFRCSRECDRARARQEETESNNSAYKQCVTLYGLNDATGSIVLHLFYNEDFMYNDEPKHHLITGVAKSAISSNNSGFTCSRKFDRSHFNSDIIYGMVLF